MESCKRILLSIMLILSIAIKREVSYGMEGQTPEHVSLLPMQLELDESKFRFKIGFEFQLSGQIFPFAMDDILLQKKPLFEVINMAGEKLWHVEIDGAALNLLPVHSHPHKRKT